VSDKDENNICSSYKIFCVKRKAKYIALTFTPALTHYPTTYDFLDICKLAINKIDDIDHAGDDMGEKRQSSLQIKGPRIFMQWLRDFWHDIYFPNPASENVQYWKDKIPIIFSNNPDLHKSFVEHTKCNLSTLSGHMMLDFYCQRLYQLLWSIIKSCMTNVVYLGEGTLSSNSCLTTTCQNFV
jgi:hypothetical protein